MKSVLIAVLLAAMVSLTYAVTGTVKSVTPIAPVKAQVAAGTHTVVEKTVKADTTVMFKIDTIRTITYDTIRTITYDTIRTTKTVKDTAIVTKIVVDTVKAKPVKR